METNTVITENTGLQGEGDELPTSASLTLGEDLSFDVPGEDQLIAQNAQDTNNNGFIDDDELGEGAEASIDYIIENFGSGESVREIDGLESIGEVAELVAPDGFVSTLATPQGLFAFIYPARFEEVYSDPNALLDLKPIVYFAPKLGVARIQSPFNVPTSVNLGAGDGEAIRESLETGLSASVPPIFGENNNGFINIRTSPNNSDTVTNSLNGGVFGAPKTPLEANVTRIANANGLVFLQKAILSGDLNFGDFPVDRITEVISPPDWFFDSEELLDENHEVAVGALATALTAYGGQGLGVAFRGTFAGEDAFLNTGEPIDITTLAVSKGVGWEIVNLNAVQTYRRAANDDPYSDLWNGTDRLPDPLGEDASDGERAFASQIYGIYVNQGDSSDEALEKTLIDLSGGPGSFASSISFELKNGSRPDSLSLDAFNGAGFGAIASRPATTLAGYFVSQGLSVDEAYDKVVDLYAEGSAQGGNAGGLIRLQEEIRDLDIPAETFVEPDVLQSATLIPATSNNQFPELVATQIVGLEEEDVEGLLEGRSFQLNREDRIGEIESLEDITLADGTEAKFLTTTRNQTYVIIDNRSLLERRGITTQTNAEEFAKVDVFAVDRSTVSDIENMVLEESGGAKRLVLNSAPSVDFDTVDLPFVASLSDDDTPNVVVGRDFDISQYGGEGLTPVPTNVELLDGTIVQWVRYENEDGQVLPDEFGVDQNYVSGTINGEQWLFATVPNDLERVVLINSSSGNPLLVSIDDISRGEGLGTIGDALGPGRPRRINMADGSVALLGRQDDGTESIFVITPEGDLRYTEAKGEEFDYIIEAFSVQGSSDLTRDVLPFLDSSINLPGDNGVSLNFDDGGVLVASLPGQNETFQIPVSPEASRERDTYLSGPSLEFANALDELLYDEQGNELGIYTVEEASDIAYGRYQLLVLDAPEDGFTNNAYRDARFETRGSSQADLNREAYNAVFDSEFNRLSTLFLTDDTEALEAAGVIFFENGAIDTSSGSLVAQLSRIAGDLASDEDLNQEIASLGSGAQFDDLDPEVASQIALSNYQIISNDGLDPAFLDAQFDLINQDAPEISRAAFDKVVETRFNPLVEMLGEAQNGDGEAKATLQSLGVQFRDDGFVDVSKGTGVEQVTAAVLAEAGDPVINAAVAMLGENATPQQVLAAINLARLGEVSNGDQSNFVPPEVNDLAALSAEVSEMILSLEELGGNEAALLFLRSFDLALGALQTADGDFTGSAIGDFLTSNAGNIGYFLSRIGAGDVSAWSAFSADLGTFINGLSDDQRTAVLEEAYGLNLTGSLLILFGSNGDEADNAAILSGELINIVADGIIAAAGEIPAGFETPVSPEFAIGAGFGRFLGRIADGTDTPLDDVAAILLEDGLPAYSALQTGTVTDQLGNVEFNGTLVGAAGLASTGGAVLDELIGGDAGRILQAVGDGAATGILAAAGAVNPAQAVIQGVDTLFDAIGVEVPPQVQLGALVALAAINASNPVGWVALGVQVVTQLFSVRDWTVVSDIAVGIDADGDLSFDDIAQLSVDFHSNFWGQVSNDGGRLQYRVESPNDLLLEEVTVDLWTGEEGAAQTFANRFRGNNAWSSFPVRVNDGVLDGGITVTGRYKPINPGTSSEPFGFRINLTQDEYAAVLAEIGTEDEITLSGDHPLLRPVDDPSTTDVNEAEPTALMRVLDNATVTFEGEKRDSNLYQYIDMNGDGNPDLVRYGIAADNDGLNTGDERYEITLMGPNLTDLGLPTIKMEDINEAGNVASLTPQLMQWAAGNLDVTQKGLDPVSLMHAAEEAGVLPELNELRNVDLLLELLPSNEGPIADRRAELVDELNLFDTSQYAAANPLLAAELDNNPLRLAYHYITSGNQEGRAIDLEGNVGEVVEIQPVWPGIISRGTVLRAGETMRRNEMLVSENGQFAAVFKQEGLLEIYDVSRETNQLLWISDTDGDHRDNGWLTMQSDGNLVIYDDDDDAIFDSATNSETGPAHGNYALVMQDDGTLAVRDQISGNILWYAGAGAADNGGEGVFVQRAAPFASAGTTPTDSATFYHNDIIYTDEGALLYLASSSQRLSEYHSEGGGDPILWARSHFITHGQFGEVALDFDVNSYLEAPDSNDLFIAFQGDRLGALNHYVTTGYVENQEGIRPDIQLDEGEIGNAASRSYEAVMTTRFGALTYLASDVDLVAEFQAVGGDPVEFARAYYENGGNTQAHELDFDPVLYLSAPGNDDLVANFWGNPEGALEYFVTEGFSEYQSGARTHIYLGEEDTPNRASQVFDTVLTSDAGALQYIASNPDLIEDIKNTGVTDFVAYARTHAQATGWSESRSLEFDPASYLQAATNGDVYVAVQGDPVRATEHYITHGYFETQDGLRDVSVSEGQEPNWASQVYDVVMGSDEGALLYLASNADLVRAAQASGSNPVEFAQSHFLEGGFAAPHPLNFDAALYISAPGNEDLVAAFWDNPVGALQHYVETGVSEYDAGNRAQLLTNENDAPNLAFELFNTVLTDDKAALQYIASNRDLMDDIKSNGVTDLVEYARAHLQTTGWSENRSNDFDVDAYLNAHSDLTDDFGYDEIAGLTHYISIGYSEPGRLVGNQIVSDQGNLEPRPALVE
ncbi:MAG: hypothetical protein AAGF53_02530 [Pseudomonadota bacterium]